ncbi:MULTISPECIES: hypothetical protein [Streptomycetaceae]|uniref:Uncharacterized protein n=1 Tax=Streptantibioticus cattleyicolor (strain ATCC 35852 / DSM 46488 / JCM 4925 / NBRC 14057 / NRRL 8057) TaxID=1003195 RepID=G8WWQ3_STREN|nr:MULTISPECIES: hypothetical protein [Streptomycetaceae]AEW94940.1 hypothetical protein SCATT_25690 [Streptantibioticus cattleyicolor NRRL 8057 = DSM 46488]MYS59545.1 hypothetical protein [Streptomyces sp. SID5468]
MASSPGPQAMDQQDLVALAEIEWCGELMIAATAVGEGRLSAARIDEVLDVSRAPAKVPTQSRRPTP